MGEFFGKTIDGNEIKLFNIRNDKMSINILEYGAVLQSLEIFGRDVVLGFDSMEGYNNDDAYIGSIAGRYANRIPEGKLIINGTQFLIDKNEKNKNHLHGGNNGFNKKIWSITEASGSLICKLESHDGDGGYPGNIKAEVEYKLKGTDLIIKYRAESDKDTALNMTNHSYFNLDGFGDIMNHELYINSGLYAETDGELLPTGSIINVQGTPMDFTSYKKVGMNMDSNSPGMSSAGGYDHNYFINIEKSCKIYGKQLFEAARLKSGGVLMKVFTDKPCVQLYTGDYLNSEYPGKNKKAVGPRAGLCLETQFMPNDVNINNNYLKAGELYEYMTVFRFSVEEG